MINRLIRTTRISSEKYVYDCIQINIEDFVNNGYNIIEIRNAINKTILKIKNMDIQNADMKIVQLEECVRSLNMKIRKGKELERLEASKKTNWRRAYGKIKGRQVNKKQRLKGILKRRNSQRGKVLDSRYIRIPYKVGGMSINQEVRKIFKNKTNTASTTRRDRKMDTIIKKIQSGKKNNENNPQGHSK